MAIVQNVHLSRCLLEVLARLIQGLHLLLKLILQDAEARGIALDVVVLLPQLRNHLLRGGLQIYDEALREIIIFAQLAGCDVELIEELSGCLEAGNFTGDALLKNLNHGVRLGQIVSNALRPSLLLAQLFPLLEEAHPEAFLVGGDVLHLEPGPAQLIPQVHQVCVDPLVDGLLEFVCHRIGQHNVLAELLQAVVADLVRIAQQHDAVVVLVHTQPKLLHSAVGSHQLLAVGLDQSVRGR
mmetsp:Transcript_88265/g.189472  ORF Transcript_88265/g.189472 Transcript_88265/m.189472 type:complete len:240 (+) Transcript_88265:529-1248(+)